MRKRLTTGQLRDAERDEVRQFNDNTVSLPNPDASPVFDRHAPIPSAHKALAFGMEPTSPKRLFELPRGDSGAGQTVYRRTHFFYDLGPAAADVPPAEFGRVIALPYTRAIGLATMRSVNQRPKYFHVSVFGISVRRPPLAPPGTTQVPLSQTVIESQQFESIFFGAGAGLIELTRPFVPAVAVCQARIMVHDESGQRFFDVDVIGNRNFSVYGWGVTVFGLVKTGGYEVDFQNPDMIIPLTGNAVGVEDDIFAGRIVGIFANRTDNIQNRTITVTVDPAVSGLLPVIVPIPPGARKVQVIAHDVQPAAPALPVWDFDFWFGRAVSRPTVGRFTFNVGQSKTAIIQIANAPSLAITPANALLPATSFSIIYQVEA